MGDKEPTSFSSEDKKNIGKILFHVNLNENQPIQVEILDLASEIANVKNLEKGLFGSIPPSTLLQCASKNIMIPSSMIVPQNSPGVNIHLLIKIPKDIKAEHGSYLFYTFSLSNDTTNITLELSIRFLLNP